MGDSGRAKAKERSGKVGERSENERVIGSAAGDVRAEVGTWRAKAGVLRENERVFGASAEGVRAEVGTSCAEAEARGENKREFGAEKRAGLAQGYKKTARTCGARCERWDMEPTPRGRGAS